jgi:glycerate 2-kinase
VGNNDIAVEAAAEKAKELGYHPIIMGTHVEGEAKEMAHIYTAMALYLQQQGQREKPSPYAIASSLPVALIAGGETTVSLGSSNGKGGRNQELALSAALQLESLGLRNVVLASVGTDGTDGPTDAAGAVVDGTTVTRDLAAAQEALDQHNAYPLLEEWTKDGRGAPLIKTGPTGTNVADVCVTLVSKARE